MRSHPAASVHLSPDGLRADAARSHRDAVARVQARPRRSAVPGRRRDRAAHGVVERRRSAGRHAARHGDDRGRDLRRPSVLGSAQRPRATRDGGRLRGRVQRPRDHRQADARPARLLRGEPGGGHRLDPGNRQLVHGVLRGSSRLHPLRRRVPRPLSLFPRQGRTPRAAGPVRADRERTEDRDHGRRAHDPARGQRRRAAARALSAVRGAPVPRLRLLVEPVADDRRDPRVRDRARGGGVQLGRRPRAPRRRREPLRQLLLGRALLPRALPRAVGRVRARADGPLAAQGRHAEVTKLPRLYVVMLRYVFAAIALASSYVAATALNDLADEQIDKVNHPRDAGRPLVEGTATRRELLVLHVVASGLALLAAAPLGLRGIGLLVSALVVSQIYSARPVRLSYGVAGAPLVLGVGYVLVPYSLGIVAAGGDLRHAWSALSCALFLLFAARIVLKDFRDREGDARYGKPTLLLRYGKTATCAASLCALTAGDVVLAFALEPGLV